MANKRGSRNPNTSNPQRTDNVRLREGRGNPVEKNRKTNFMSTESKDNYKEAVVGIVLVGITVIAVAFFSHLKGSPEEEAQDSIDQMVRNCSSMTKLVTTNPETVRNVKKHSIVSLPRGRYGEVIANWNVKISFSAIEDSWQPQKFQLSCYFDNSDELVDYYYYVQWW